MPSAPWSSPARHWPQPPSVVVRLEKLAATTMERPKHGPACGHGLKAFQTKRLFPAAKRDKVINSQVHCPQRPFMNFESHSGTSSKKLVSMVSTKRGSQLVEVGCCQLTGKNASADESIATTNFTAKKHWDLELRGRTRRKKKCIYFAQSQSGNGWT